MVSFRALTLALFAGLAVAAPLESEPETALVARQSTRWNDPYIKRPYGEKASDLGSCNYQVTFRRDGFDSRNDIRFYVTYPGSSTRRQINPVAPTTYTLSDTGIADFGRYTVPNGNNYVISVHSFRGICASGTSGNKPNAFFVRTSLNRPDYEYRNDYISPSFTASTAPVPAPPANVRITRVAGSRTNFRVDWSASAGATGGYYALIRIDVRASETGGFQRVTQTRVAAAGSTSATFSIGANDRLVSVAISSQAGANSDVLSDGTRVVPVNAPA